MLALAGATHGLKGAVANFTGGKAFHSVVLLEQVAKEADPQLPKDALNQLEREMNILLQTLKSFASAIPKA